MKIAKSDAVKQKEAQLKQTQKQHAKITKQLRKVIEKLENHKQKLWSRAEDMSKIAHLILEFEMLKKEFSEIVKKLSKSKKISAADRREYKQMHQQMEFMSRMTGADALHESPEIDEEEFIRKSQENADDRRSRFEKAFGDFSQPVPEPEQQQIRKIFLRLANKFHPDKSQNEQQAAMFHTIMHQLNAAYEKNDLSTLLHIEAQYATMDFTLPNENESGILDFLERQINKLDTEISLLTQQLLRTKAELFDLERTEESKELKRHERSNKNKDDVEVFGYTEDEMNFNLEMVKLQIEGHSYLLEHGAYPEGFDEKINELEKKYNKHNQDGNHDGNLEEAEINDFLNEIMNAILGSQADDDDDDYIIPTQRKRRQRK